MLTFGGHASAAETLDIAIPKLTKIDVRTEQLGTCAVRSVNS